MVVGSPDYSLNIRQVRPSFGNMRSDGFTVSATTKNLVIENGSATGKTAYIVAYVPCVQVDAEVTIRSNITSITGGTSTTPNTLDIGSGNTASCTAKFNITYSTDSGTKTLLDNWVESFSSLNMVMVNKIALRPGNNILFELFPRAVADYFIYVAWYEENVLDV